MNHLAIANLNGYLRTENTVGAKPIWAEKTVFYLGFLVVHIPLALLIYKVPVIGVLQALVALLFGVVEALRSVRPVRCVYAIAYIVGAEVLWRMCEVPVPWEVGKYAAILIATAALVSMRRRRLDSRAVVYICFLLPSALLTLLVYGPSGVKSIFTSAYSGPIALASTYLCLSCLSVSRRELQNILLGLVGPILGIAVIAVFGFVTAADVVFSEDSNLATSGGFGPNQVSTILGLGVLACFLSLFLFTGKRLVQLVLFGVMIFLAAQSAFTFSRSGLYNASVGIVIASLWLLTDARTRTRLVIAIVPAIILAVAVIIPTLNQISGDTLSARFQDTSVSGRDELALIDLNIWLENPLLGVGPGRSREIHRVLHPGSTMAHTEFTRMLAEHGTLGLISIVALALMAWQSFYRAKSPMDKALVGALVGWTIMFMLNSAMRTAGPAFAFGLASIKVIPSTRFSLRTKRTTPRTAFRQL